MMLSDCFGCIPVGIFVTAGMSKINRRMPPRRNGAVEPRNWKIAPPRIGVIAFAPLTKAALTPNVVPT